MAVTTSVSNWGVNKKSISDLINILTEYKYINKEEDQLPQILTACFETKKKFTHSNLSSKNNPYSEHYNEIEDIIKGM